MNERIKKLRKALGLTQAEFGSRISMKQNTIALIEGGRNTSNQTIFAICREFGVSESWLRTGEGEMFSPTSRDQEITAFVDRALAGQPDSFKRRFVSMLSRLNEDGWELLEKMASELAAQQAAATPAPPDDLAAIEREVEAYRAQLLAGKKAAGSSSPSSGTGAG
ncbi:helix-turn-helix domain-containing protein [Vermiculatibacterium agrestimuris]|uniref:helix-turn-helix domain-containing protein n=1 Tax=Vermiculatibacterium agrestimuris TaxID=2941519 RepID=UPI0020426B13|nr:helix-turn-helix transcriptional regulator [Vermiculatibacterium agrestimuris]